MGRGCHTGIGYLVNERQCVSPAKGLERGLTDSDAPFPTAFPHQLQLREFALSRRRHSRLQCRQRKTNTTVTNR